MKKIACITVAVVFALTGCSTQSIVVDPKSVKDQATYETDMKECKEIAESYDKTGNVAGSSVAGAVAGGGLAAGVATAVAGAVFAPAIPFIIGGALLFGGGAGGMSKSSETDAREKIVTNCLNDRGYRAYKTT